MDYKRFIADAVSDKIKAVAAAGSDNWETVRIGYVSAQDPRFLNDRAAQSALLGRIPTHPKTLYSPGRTVICHHLPINRSYSDAYQRGLMDEANWERLCRKTWMLSMELSDVISQTLTDLGRIVALLSQRDGWSHAYGASLADLGYFLEAGDLFEQNGQLGCLGSVITELDLFAKQS